MDLINCVHPRLSAVPSLDFPTCEQSQNNLGTGYPLGAVEIVPVRRAGASAVPAGGGGLERYHGRSGRGCVRLGGKAMNTCKCWAAVLVVILLLPKVAAGADAAAEACKKGKACIEKKEYAAAVNSVYRGHPARSGNAQAYDSRGRAYGGKASGTRPSLTTAKPSGWIQRTPGPTAAAAGPTRKNGEFDKAIADLNEAIRLDPKDAKVYGSRGWVYWKRAIRQGSRRLQRGHSARPEGRRGLPRSRLCLRAEARVGQGHRRLQRGHSPQPEGRCGLQRPRVDLWRKSASSTRPSPTIARPFVSTRRTPRRTSIGV